MISSSGDSTWSRKVLTVKITRVADNGLFQVSIEALGSMWGDKHTVPVALSWSREDDMAADVGFVFEYGAYTQVDRETV